VPGVSLDEQASQAKQKVQPKRSRSAAEQRIWGYLFLLDIILDIILIYDYNLMQRSAYSLHRYNRIVLFAGVVSLALILACMSGCGKTQSSGRTFVWIERHLPVYPASDISVDNTLMKAFRTGDEAGSVFDYYQLFCQEQGLSLEQVDEGTADYDVKISSGSESILLSIKKFADKTNIVFSGKDLGAVTQE